MSKFLKKICVGFLSVIIVLYVLFLTVPFFLTGIVNSYNSTIVYSVEKSTGFKLTIDNINLVTTPKLSAGAKIGHLELSMPNGEKFLSADNAHLRMSLIPLLIRKIELDKVGVDNINVNLKLKKDGTFLLEDFIPQSQPSQSTGEKNSVQGLPFGLKLSNKLPDIIVRNYNISFIDISNDKPYSIYGDRAFIKDFILNKKIKVEVNGKAMFQDRVQFNYDLKVLNKIMPDIDLQDMVFGEKINVDNSSQPQISFNILDLFKILYKNQLTADVSGDIKTSGSLENVNLLGKLNVTNLGVAVDSKKLPPSNVDMYLKGNGIKLYSKLYSAEKELTEIVGDFKLAKSPKISLNCKSNAQFKSVIDMIDSVLTSFGYNELNSLSATGGIDADFDISTNLKKVESSGYLKIPSASLNYGLYNVAIDGINADIDFSNNIVNIKESGFTVLGQPLKLRGSVDQNAVADLSLLADKLQLKGLLLALGQAQLLKDNKINSGTLSLNVLVKGKLDKIQPKINVSVNDVNIKNIPSDLTLSMLNSTVNLTGDGKKIDGKVNLKNLNVINPFVPLSVPSASLVMDEKDINLVNSYALLNNYKIDIVGKVTNYLSDNLGLDISAKDTKVLANIKGNISDLYKTQKLNLDISVPDKITFEIPGFRKSSLTATGKVNVSGPMLNPVLKGDILVPEIKIPDMFLTMNDLLINLNGTILKGKGTLKKFISGGIVAENLSSDFNLANNVFYLKNLTGDAFSGKINGDISYNVVNGLIGVKLKGSGMDAEKAIAGAAGIKNALSGTLGFNADVTLFGATDVEMMKNLKGKASFEIVDGTLANLGRFENFLFAQNLQSNSILKAALASVSSIPAIKNTSQFKTISGDMTFNNGWVNLNSVKTSGPSMAYYITGKYNLLNASANVVILGRISAEIVSLLGPLGDLSVTKLTSFIPKFGAATGNIINALTTNPKGENVAAIPQLSSGNTNYKDFKVVFNGGMESKSSVKSFKWLSVCDTSAIEAKSVKEQFNDTKQAVQETIQTQKDAYLKRIEEQKKQAQEAKQQMQDAAESIKNLKNLFK